jgi:kynurenine 3-monooxygenase
MKQEQIVIIGAGLVGSLLSIYLVKRGYGVTVYERRPDSRLGANYAGRSINLALSDRGIKALEEVGAMEMIKTVAIPMHGRVIHNTDGNSAYQAYGKEGQYINAVSRGDLNSKLMDIAEQEGVRILFNEKCTDINWNENEITFEHSVTANKQQVKADIIFGSDGAFAASRLQHQLQQDRFEYQQTYIDYGYKELTIPAGEGGQFLMEKNALHIWPRGNYMLIALPNPGGSFTGTLFFPFNGEPSFASLDTKEKLHSFFTTEFADACGMMPSLAEEFFANPTGSLVTVKCYPWVRNSKFALIGDAAHAIVPFFGQGMNCGFEDCSVLNSLIGKYNGDWDSIFSEYQQLRKPDADAIAELALNNFVEMRDRVGDPKFLLQKKIEAQFSSRHPDKWIPAYAQVTFSPQIRYSEALRNGARQEAIMQEVMKLPDIETNWDSDIVEKMMLEKLKEAHV